MSSSLNLERRPLATAEGSGTRCKQVIIFYHGTIAVTLLPPFLTPALRGHGHQSNTPATTVAIFDFEYRKKCPFQKKENSSLPTGPAPRPGHPSGQSRIFLQHQYRGRRRTTARIFISESHDDDLGRPDLCHHTKSYLLALLLHPSRPKH